MGINEACYFIIKAVVSSELWKSRGNRFLQSKALSGKSPKIIERFVAILSTTIVINTHTPTNLIVDPNLDTKFQVVILSG